MQNTREIAFTLNGEEVSHRVPVRQHLADFLRHELGLTGTHIGCEQGVCGACTIRVNGRSARSCLMLAVQADGCVVETIEGISQSGEIADLQHEFIQRNAAQCAFCTPGMLMTAADLIGGKEPVSRDAIRDHISGNYCRCTGYHAIVDAIESTLNKRLASDKSNPHHG
ncbi:(2Fe-2S)-binding protein [Pseudomaricurvus alkylphenolicus]|uniref:(2Fe-2S)-binding protein n=1 Tax=Pseudomaricurvus alkylphenolicus TaxID=1306991 RepID=UPI00141F33AE|nr:(2Fe-2S)-binding protein [Pseudomaricurvus alkylphenolicus]NIB40849.1 (2Fe-2S)-binding protein [Pseudomaricurvus alkylphenolicus]